MSRKTQWSNKARVGVVVLVVYIPNQGNACSIFRITYFPWTIEINWMRGSLNERDEAASNLPLSLSFSTASAWGPPPSEKERPPAPCPHAALVSVGQSALHWQGELVSGQANPFLPHRVSKTLKQQTIKSNVYGASIETQASITN